MRFSAKLLIVAVMSLAVGASQAQQSTSPGDDESQANAAIAERVAQMGQMALAANAIGPATLRESAALLEAASKLAPNEPRFLRLLTEAYLQIGGDEGRDGAIGSLTRYRKLVPDDIGAQIRLIDLFYSQQQSASDCKKYLEQLVGVDTLSPTVKSHVFVLAAKLSQERSEEQRAQKFIGQALDLFPLSPEALRFQYQLLDANSPSAKRVEVLLQLLRSNPAQPWAMAQLGTEAAAVGLVDPSLIWFQNSQQLTQRMNMATDPNQMISYAAELVIADQLRLADSELQRLSQQDATNVDVATLSLLVAKRNGNADQVQAATDALRAALLGRLNQVSQTLNGRGSAATTQPNTQVDIAGDVKKLAAANNQDLSAAYSTGLARLAWLEIYFNGKTADAQPYVTALQQLVSPESVTLTRLAGWSYLIDGKKDEAKVKLSAVADRDPLSELGMIRIESGESPDHANADAIHLLTSNPSGVMGALLIEALRDRVSQMPQGPDAQDVHAELDKFPTGWLDFIDPQKVKLMYSLKAEPLKVAHVFGEPILARITIANTSDYDITIDPNGAIRPDVWIDAKIRGIAEQYLSGVAIDRLAGKPLLHPKDSVSEVVRVDQDGLANTLQGNPAVAVPLYFNALTNPLTLSSGISPGPGGYRVQFTKVVERGASPLKQETIDGLYTQLVSGVPDARVNAIELLGTYVRYMRKHGDDESKNKAGEMAEMIHKSTGDSLPSVRAEASFVTALLAEPTAADAMVRRMLSDDSFAMRVFGLEALPRVMPPAKQKELAGPLAKSDSDPIVRQLATGVIQVADLPPTSQPTTQSAASQTAGAEK